MTDAPAGPEAPAKPAPEAKSPPGEIAPEPGHLPGIEAPPPSGAAAAVAVILLVVVVLLLVLMVTGINDNIPYLHPGTQSQVTIEGDRVTLSYLYVANGTTSNSTIGYICSQCPITLGEGEGFSLTVNVVNTNNASEDVLRITTVDPFAVVLVNPGTTTPIAAGLSQPFTVEVKAPATAGTYIVPLTVSINVS